VTALSQRISIYLVMGYYALLSASTNSQNDSKGEISQTGYNGLCRKALSLRNRLIAPATSNALALAKPP